VSMILMIVKKNRISDMSNNLIYQCRLGIHPDWSEHSVKSMSAYADKVSAQYMFSRSSTLRGLDENIMIHRYFNILDLIYDKKFEAYDDILYADTDVLADPDAEDIFGIPKAKHIDVVGVPEKAIGDGHPGFMQKRWINLYREKYERFNIPIIYKNVRQVNTGVILFTKKGRLKARERFEYWLPWASDLISNTVMDNDQPYLNAMFDKYQFNVMDIDDKWNMPVSWFNDTPCPKSNFYHFSGGRHDDLITSFVGSNTPEGKKFSLNKNKFN